MSWFYDTFLPSLLERAGTNKGMWLSRKQTAICIEKWNSTRLWCHNFRAIIAAITITRWNGMDGTSF